MSTIDHSFREEYTSLGQQGGSEAATARTRLKMIVEWVPGMQSASNQGIVTNENVL